jgi:hypothetical protein
VVFVLVISFIPVAYEQSVADPKKCAFFCGFFLRSLSIYDTVLSQTDTVRTRNQSAMRAVGANVWRPGLAEARKVF